MLRNFIQTVVRNVKHNKLLTSIQMSGLILGLTTSFPIYLFIMNELSFDRYHEKADQIYRITQEKRNEGGLSHTTLTPNPLAPEVKSVFSEVIDAVRINQIHRKVTVRYKNNRFREDRFILTDPSFFRIFSFPLIKGNPETVFQNPLTVVITEAMAEKYFGPEDPIGRMLQCDERIDLEVVGVMKNIPSNSHFHCDFIVSFTAADMIYWKDFSTDRTQSSVRTYLLVQEQSDVEILETKLQEFVHDFMAPVIRQYESMIDQIPGGKDPFIFNLHLQPLKRIHLHSHFSSEFEPNFSVIYIILYASACAIILLLASMNFINLTIARSVQRVKEIGLRQVLGAQRKHIFTQFWIEAFLFCMTALVLSLVIIVGFWPYMMKIYGAELILNTNTMWLGLIGAVFVICVISLVSGVYPANTISRGSPVAMANRPFHPLVRQSARKILIIIQFAVSIILIVSTCVLNRQIKYITRKDLGFRRKDMLVIPMESDRVTRKYRTLKSDLMRHSNILGITGSSNLLSRVYASTPVWWEGAREDESVRIQKLYVDNDFTEIFGLRIVEGSTFPSGQPTVRNRDFLLNEEARRIFGWSSAVGKKIAWFHERKEPGLVIGVFGSFHFRSLHQQIEPLVLQRGEQFDYMYILIDGGRISETLEWIQQRWRTLFADRPFEYFFLDEHIENMYQSEYRLHRIFQFASYLAVLIASMGLFGITLYTAERRTRECAIRKVLGAGPISLFRLYSGEYLRLILVAHLSAGPVAWMVMRRWLNQFAYRITFDTGIFLYAALLIIGVTLSITTYNLWKIVFTNPVNTLKYE